MSTIIIPDFTFNPNDGGTDGDDTLYGDDLRYKILNGGAGFDIAAFDDRTAASLVLDPSYLSDGNTNWSTSGTLEHVMVGFLSPNQDVVWNYNALRGIEAIRTSDGFFLLEDALANAFSVSTFGVGSSLRLATPYTGPLALDTQLITGSANDAIAGTARNDFINASAGNDAIDGGAGNDVIDGGTGSNFLTGGAGTDTFFVDGRGGATTWSTITDWEAGEQLSLWGFIPGTSTLTWQDMAGAEGYQGITLHADLDGNGTIDTSITWAGRSSADIPSPQTFADQQLLWFVSP